LTQAAVSGKLSEEQSKTFIQEVNNAQSTINKEYNKQYVENHLKNLKMNFIQEGSLSHTLSSTVCEDSSFKN